MAQNPWRKQAPTSGVVNPWRKSKASPQAESPDADRPGLVGGALRAGAQGLTFGFSDELRGLGAALMPGGDDYATARDKERGALKDFREDHPVISKASEIAGGMVLPGAAALRAAKGVQAAAGSAGAVSKALAARKGLAMAKAAVPAAAAYSFGAAEGTPGEQALQTAGGTLLGAAAAPLLPAAGSGVAKVARKVFPKGRTAAAEASERVLGNILRDQQTPRGLQQVAQQAAASGMDDVALADLGPNLRGELDWVASTPGKGMAAVREWSEQRQGTLRPILQKAYETITGRKAVGVKATEQAIRQAQLAAGNAAYEPLFAKVGTQAIPDEQLVAVTSDLTAIPGLVGYAKKLAAAHKVPKGEWAQWGEGEAFVPTARFAHYLKQAADDLASRADPKLAAGLKQRARDMNVALEGVLGDGYKAANAEWAGFAKQLEALKLGTQVFSPSLESGTVQQAVAGMTPEVREAFQKGLDAAMRRKVWGQSLTSRDANAWWMNPETQAKVRAAFPDDASWQRFVDGLRWTREKAATSNVGLGSQTAGRSFRDEDAGMSVWGMLRHPKQAMASVAAVVKKDMDRRAKERVAAEMPAWLTASGGALQGKLGELDLLAQAILLEQINREAAARAGAVAVSGGRR